MLVISELINTFWLPLVMAQFIDVATRDGVNPKTAGKLAMLLSFLVLRSIASWIFHGPARIMENNNAFQVRVSYREYLLRGVMSVPYKWHVEHHSGETIDKIGKGAMGLYDFTSESFQIVKPLIRLVGSMGMVLYFSPLSIFVVVGMLVLSGIFTMSFDKVLAPLYRDLNKQENEIAKRVQDVVTNISTVVVLRVENVVIDSLIKVMKSPFEMFKKNNKFNELKWFVTSLCANSMTAMVLGVYLYQHRDSEGGVTLSGLYLILNYLDKIGELFYDFTSLNGWMIRKKFNLLNAEELSKDFVVEEKPAEKYLPKNWQKVSVAGLTFSYSNNDDPEIHLDDVSLEIVRGSRIAVVGKSGDGKSTYLKITRGLYEPMISEVIVDGEKISGEFLGMSGSVSYVPQDPELFDTTVLENITLGREFSNELIEKYCEMACFSQVIDKLPHGIQSSIKEKGVNLSGGQAQRLALTRGLLASHDSDIVLLDEPTSSLDPTTEMIVYQNIFKGFAGKTIISSVHRLNLLPLFDMVYMFEDGRIVGSGNLQTLLSTCHEFQTLWADWQKHKEEVEAY